MVLDETEQKEHFKKFLDELIYLIDNSTILIIGEGNYYSDLINIQKNFDNYDAYFIIKKYKVDFKYVKYISSLLDEETMGELDDISRSHINRDEMEAITIILPKSNSYSDPEKNFLFLVSIMNEKFNIDLKFSHYWLEYYLCIINILFVFSNKKGISIVI